MQWLLRLSVITIKFLAFKNCNCLKCEIELNLALFPEWSKHLYKVLNPTTILILLIITSFPKHFPLWNNLQSYIKITEEKLEILRSTVPWKTLIQPSGTPASWASFIINMGANGFLGEGLITMVLPQTNAMGNICEQIKAKRLNRTNKSCHILQNILERQKKLYKICTFELCNTDAALQR